MAEVPIDPVADTRNEGWTFSNLLTTLFESFLRSTGDDDYAQSPDYKGRAAVSFPVDIEDVPTGAVITSVKINIRCKKASGNYSVTCNLMSSDDLSKFTSRTLYPTTSFADYEVGSYTVDPLGYAWDIERLNKLVVQVFTYANTNNAIQVSGVWATINYRHRPNITVTDPTGNLATASPTLDWSYSQVEGDVQSKAEYKIFESTQVTAPTFNPDKSTPVTSGTVRGDKTTLVLPVTLDTGSYYVYIRSFSGVGAVSEWGSKSFSIEAPHPGIPTASVTGDGTESKTTITMQDTSNLLSAVQADAEVSADKDEYLATDCTMARSSAQVFGTGAASYSLTATSTADMSITSDYFRIAPDKDVTIRAQTFAETDARTNSLTLTFYDSTYTTTGTAISVTDTDSTTDWTELVATGTTAMGAVYGKLTYEVAAPAASEVHYVDHLGVMYGTNSSWTPGGHTSRNLADSDLGGSPSDWGFTGAPGTVTSLKTDESRTGASGQRVLNLARVNPEADISFVGVGDVTTGTPDTTTIVIDNINAASPGTLQAGDLMIAYIVTDRLGTITGLPTGWTAVDSAQIQDGSDFLSLHVISKIAGGGDVIASNYTASFELPYTRASSRMVAYRGSAAVESNFNPSGTSTNTTNTALTLKTATLNNTTSNAWRLSAFAALDNAAGHGTTGSWTAAEYGSGGVTSNISYVGVGTSWSAVTYASPASVRWYKPSGVAVDDIMIAQISWWETNDNAGASPGLTVPSGWTLAAYNKSATGANSPPFGGEAAECATAILWRKATSADASVTSYTTNLTGSNPQTGGAKKMRMAMCVAYRGVDGTSPFIAQSMNGLGVGDGTSSSISVPGSGSSTISNTDSKAWSVTMFAVHGFNDAANGSGGWRQTPTQPQRYFLPRVDDGFIQDGHSVACFDSNGVINTGTVSRTGIIPGDTDQESHPLDGANAWLGILKPATTPYVPGPDQWRRIDNSTGSDSRYLNWSAFDNQSAADSLDVISSGDAAVLGTYTPASGTDLISSVSWHGILIPATPVVDGLLQADMDNYIDISQVSESVLASADNKMTLGAAFIAETGTSGTPLLSLKFYRATTLLEAPVLEGSGFGDDAWVYSARSFDIPEGTTRVKASLSVPDRVNGDEVDVDRITIAFGSDVNIWKNGTTLGLHPIWNAPVIEYQDNDGTGWSDWAPVGGMSFNPPVFDYLTGECSFDDHTIVPLTARRYRVSAYTYGLRGDSTSSVPSATTSEVTVTATTWWLKDLENPENNMILPVRAEEIQISATNTASAFQPLGEDYPVVITEGFKSNQIQLPLVAQRTDWAAFRKLVRSGRSLYLQSDIDDAFWVRPISNIEAETLVSAQRQSDPYRTVKVTFIQTAPEA